MLVPGGAWEGDAHTQPVAVKTEAEGGRPHDEDTTVLAFYKPGHRAVSSGSRVARLSCHLSVDYHNWFVRLACTSLGSAVQLNQLGFKVYVHQSWHRSTHMVKSGWILGPVSWRPTTVKWRQFSQSNRHSKARDTPALRHSIIGTRQTEYHEALPSSANVLLPRRSPTMVTLRDSRFVECRCWNDGLDCENCRHLTVVGLHDTSPWFEQQWSVKLTLICWPPDSHSAKFQAAQVVNTITNGLSTHCLV